ncbi:MAG: Dickkopf N-terminal cysteine-rich domain-containing protein [Alphaproteobacteria bacterium]
MFKKITAAAALGLSLFLVPAAALADECKADADCKEGKICIMAVTPHVCKPPQEAGAVCKRDAVCASKKCEIPAGQAAGVCK